MQAFENQGFLAPPPSYRYGWGGASFESIVDASTCNSYFADQSVVLTPSSPRWEKVLHVADMSKPVILALVWTDAASIPGAPDLKNDLTVVLTPECGSGPNVQDCGEYFGNNFSFGITPVCIYPCVPSYDHANNVEKVVAWSPQQIHYPPGFTWNGNLYVDISSQGIIADGVQINGPTLRQDFALVVLNAYDTCP
jgi:hypothetical protein